MTGILVVLVHVLGHRGFVFAAFDPEGARVQGMPVRRLDAASWALIALTLSVCTRALGALAVFAFAVLPAAAALLLSNRLRWVLLLAAAFGAVSGGAGYVVAFFYSFPVGPCQTAIAFALFLVGISVRLLRSRA